MTDKKKKRKVPTTAEGKAAHRWLESGDDTQYRKYSEMLRKPTEGEVKPTLKHGTRVKMQRAVDSYHQQIARGLSQSQKEQLEDIPRDALSPEAKTRLSGVISAWRPEGQLQQAMMPNPDDYDTRAVAPNASGEVDLYAPSTYEAPSHGITGPDNERGMKRISPDPAASMPTFMGAMQAMGQAMPANLGGAVEMWHEPTLSSFAAYKGSHWHDELDEDSLEYKQFSDRKWAAARHTAQAEGRSIQRVKYAGDDSPEYEQYSKLSKEDQEAQAGNLVMHPGMGNRAARGLNDVAEGLAAGAMSGINIATFGMGGEALSSAVGFEQAAKDAINGKEFDPDARAAEFDAEQQDNMARHPVYSVAGGLIGGLHPLSASRIAALKVIGKVQPVGLMRKTALAAGLAAGENLLEFGVHKTGDVLRGTEEYSIADIEKAGWITVGSVAGAGALSVGGNMLGRGAASASSWTKDAVGDLMERLRRAGGETVLTRYGVKLPSNIRAHIAAADAELYPAGPTGQRMSVDKGGELKEKVSAARIATEKMAKVIGKDIRLRHNFILDGQQTLNNRIDDAVGDELVDPRPAIGMIREIIDQRKNGLGDNVMWARNVDGWEKAMGTLYSFEPVHAIGSRSVHGHSGQEIMSLADAIEVFGEGTVRNQLPAIKALVGGNVTMGDLSQMGNVKMVVRVADVTYRDMEKAMQSVAARASYESSKASVDPGFRAVDKALKEMRDAVDVPFLRGVTEPLNDDTMLHGLSAVKRKQSLAIEEMTDEMERWGISAKLGKFRETSSRLMRPLQEKLANGGPDVEKTAVKYLGSAEAQKAYAEISGTDAADKLRDIALLRNIRGTATSRGINTWFSARIDWARLRLDPIIRVMGREGNGAHVDEVLAAWREMPLELRRASRNLIKDSGDLAQAGAKDVLALQGVYPAVLQTRALTSGSENDLDKPISLEEIAVMVGWLEAAKLAWKQTRTALPSSPEAQE